MKKSLIKLGVILFTVFLFSKPVYAENTEVVIDGQFDDWTSIASYDISSESTYFDQVSAAYDDLYVYIHVKEKASEAWETNYPTIDISCNGNHKNIQIVRKNYDKKNGIYEIQVKNDWWKTISNTDGKVSRQDGYNEWEFRVPINEISIANSDERKDNLKECVVDSLKVFWSKGGNVELVGDYIGITTPEVTTTPVPTITPAPTMTPAPTIIPAPTLEATATPTSETTATTKPGDLSDAIIKIDGYYDDWENMPKSNVFYSERCKNKDSLVKDDNYIYLFVEMASAYEAQIPLDSIELTVNGKYYCNLFVRYPNSDGTTDWSKPVTNLAEGNYTGLAPFTSYPNNSLGDAAVSISSGDQGDRLELRINISDLEKNMGLEAGTINSGANILVHLSNVGKQPVEVVGVSTGPIIGIIISALAVIAVIAFKSKGKK